MANINSAIKTKGAVDKHCNTDINLKTCNFSWTINEYSVFKKTDLERLKSVVFSAVDDDFKWHLIHRIETLMYYDRETSERNYSIRVIFYAKPDFEDLEKYGIVYVNVKVSAVKPDNTEIQTIKASYKWIGDAGQCYVGSFGLFSEVLKWTHEDKLKFICELSYLKKNDIGNLPSLCCSKPVDISESSLSTDFERFLTDDNNFKDVTISVKGKNYPVHKTVLAARSSVFNAMFKSDMIESQKNHVFITDIDQETFEEMLHFIYTGKTKNLQESAFKLLPAADKYHLRELKTMCEEVLLRKLSTDNAARILILADMHYAEDLKAHALRFIKVNHHKCENFKKPEVWNIVTKSRPHLMKDLLDVIFR